MTASDRLDERHTGIARRRLLTAGGSAALLVGVAPAILPSRARAQPKTLKIMQWKHFVPSYDTWFNETYVKAWGEHNDTEVIVDNVGAVDLPRVAAAEAAAGHGHDLVLFITPQAIYEDQVIDHREIHDECQRLYGPLDAFANKCTYNPITRKYFGFCCYYLPAVITYRGDLWDGVEARPDSWQEILDGGRRIKLLDGNPVGISLAPEWNCEYTMRAIMYSFGASEQDSAGNPALKSPATLDAIKYVSSLYSQAMTKEVLGWDAPANNRFMVSGSGSLTLDTMSIARASEALQLPIAKDLRLAPVPQGPAARIGISFGLFTFVIWKFGANVEGAKKFLIDYVAHSRDAFLASGFQNMPAFQQTVPDLRALVTTSSDRSAPGKYDLISDSATWTTNIGHPGYTNAAISEIYNTGVIAKMFARAATGQLTAEETLDQADREVRQIWEKWRQNGKA